MDHSCSTQTIRLLLLCSFLFGVHDLALADPPYPLCSDNTSNNLLNSSFQNNLNTLLSLLPSEASVSKYNNTSYGNGTDRVYGQYLCLDYVSYETCQDCISVASKAIMYLCPNRTQAVVWEEDCQLRYSDNNFFGRLNVADNFCKDNIINISDPVHFQSVVENKLRNLTKRAAFNSSANMYAAGGEPYTADDTLYAMVQCTRDLSPDDCNECLEAAIKDVSSECYASRGARLLSRSCYLRYELYAFYDGAKDSSVSTKKKGGGGKKIWMIAVLTIGSAVSVILLLASTMYCVARKKDTGNGKKKLNKIGDPENTDMQNQYFEGLDELRAHDFYFDLATINSATDNFSDSKLLGQGGFGPVYKGVLPDGKEVAVKRLSSFSEQGTLEFTNEVLLILKLQHKNLVGLLGFCVDQQEKLLVYELMPNSSLDVVLFDSKKRAQLNWSRRLNIINGIARGILYLHEDSRLRIIHRDIKASNVLLDCDMNPKISDFGMARIFAGADSEANTARIVGTYGYMAPEYAMAGLYSIKSDVFSFGVLLLEIITGRRNAGFHQSKRVSSLVAYAWHLWNEGNALELMDPLLTDGCPDEFLRLIHIGLLCVEEDAFNRPTMSSVVVMLKGEAVTLCQPQQPAFSVGRFADHHQTLPQSCSVNGLTISNIAPR
ncbi:cysteine-rich receptor-like protein kinase 10 isoform X1 [Herrania umbratica]|uniref:non-specific serine/threonine protein kinase n=1 Tax=Herrania umbratica TaxID=108875 RepID=A0A6J1B3E2_9ROSI|nr:cysteine-rich receptor-like protein kinase 10 isoform X1 [Herrania umbratica]